MKEEKRERPLLIIRKPFLIVQNMSILECEHLLYH